MRRIMGIRYKQGYENTPFVLCELLLCKDMRSISAEEVQYPGLLTQLQFTACRKQILQDRLINRYLYVFSKCSG